MRSVEGAGEGEQGVLRDVQQGPRGAEHRGGDDAADPEDARRGGGLQDLRRRRELASSQLARALDQPVHGLMSTTQQRLH
jgi:hypothetical protein